MFENATFKTTRNRRPYFAARVTELGIRRRQNFQRTLTLVCGEDIALAHTPAIVFASVRQAA